MTISTEDLRQLLGEATQDDFPTTRHDGKAKLDKVSIQLAAELIAAHAKIEAAEKLYAALDSIIDGRMWSMSDNKFGASKAALAAWEAAQ